MTIKGRNVTAQILDLRDEASFGLARIRGSYNIPVHSLWGDNRWWAAYSNYLCTGATGVAIFAQLPYSNPCHERCER